MSELLLFVFGVSVGGCLGVFLTISKYRDTVLSMKRQVERIDRLHK